MKVNTMNKIQVDNIILNNENIFIENQNVTKITAEGKCEINLFNCNIINLDILVLENSCVCINYFNKIKNLESLINIKASNKSSITFNHSYINYEKYDLKIDTDFLNEEANVFVNIHGINDKGKSNIDVNGFVKTNKYNNVLNENIHIYNINNGTCASNPNMYINTSKVIANHNTTIGTIRKDELFYLMSKGLNYENSVKLIIQGFLINVIKTNELVTKIKEILN